jgi:purine-binding chemotaxis protein CheW
MSSESSTLDPQITIESVVAELDRLTPAMAVESSPSPAVSKSARILVFELGGSVYGCPLEHAAEVQRLPAVTRLPHMPGWLSGVANLRGEVVSIVDLRTFFDLPAAAADPHRRLLILRSLTEEMRVGVIIDRLIGLRNQGEVHSAHATNARSSADAISPYLQGVCIVPPWTVGLLDVEKWLSSADLRQFR